MKEYVLTPVAFADMSDALVYLSEHNATAAEALALSLYDCFRMLARFPKSGRRRPEFTSAEVRFWPIETYLIVYSSESTPLEIIGVLHASRDIQDILAGRFIEG